MTGPLEIIWANFDSPDPQLSHDELTRWATDDITKLQNLGLLTTAARTDLAACTACPDHHVEVVTVLEGEDGRRRYFVPCPENLRVEISINDLRRWTIDFNAIATILARSLKAVGRITCRVPGRLWRLGRVEWHGTGRELVLARGLHWTDAATLVQSIDSNGRNIVFVVDRVPVDDIWPDIRPPIIVLSEVAYWTGATIDIRVIDVAANVRDADARNQCIRPITLTTKQQKQALREAASEVLKTHLQDEALIQAYQEYGSLRKAAEALTTKTGIPISKDKVKRAVDRSGGLEAVRHGSDSESVRRAVASQRRDRQRKFASPTQPPGVQ